MVKSGFTLIELMIVVAIISSITVMLTIRFQSSQGKGRDAQRKSDLKQYQTALEVYANSNDNLYPPTSGLLANLCGSLNVLMCPEDPLGDNNYRYTVDGSALHYYLWATLEQPDDNGATKYFVICSGGNVGEVSVMPSGVSCPL